MPLDPFGEDLYLDWNSDFLLTAAGTLQTALGWDRIRQRIIRRIITNSAQLLPSGRWTSADYIYHQKYGLGLGSMVDQPFSEASLAVLEGVIATAVLQDDNIDSASPPQIQFFRRAPTTLYVVIYVTLLSGVPGQISLQYNTQHYQPPPFGGAFDQNYDQNWG